MSLREAYTTLFLSILDKDGEIKDTADLKHEGKSVDQETVIGVLKSLESREVIKYETISREQLVLTEEGADIADNGSYEARVFYAVPEGEENGISVADLKSKLGQAAQFGQGRAIKNKWIKKSANGGFTRAVESIVDESQNLLRDIREKGAYHDEKVVKDLKKQKHISASKVTSYRVVKGDKFTTQIVKEETDITEEMLKSGEWKTATFKKYNFNAAGVQPRSGALHPLMKVREEYRQIFLELGFSEMPTAQYVESSFWNFDALFQPQQHPARDAHDTFFLSDPATSDRMPMDYVERVKQVHSVGGYGSIGYGYDWKIAEAEKLVLRTHTTAVSSNMLYKLAKEFQETGEWKPVKWFSIDKVFRNETLDATHLAEFHQIEGVVADRGLTLGDLIGTLHGFFKKLGIQKLRFKPAYNPYTEPSMEIFAWHDGLNKWVEIGNSGMFRPEMLLPMGLPEDVAVIAWGLSTERPTMIKYGYNNIRDLVGHKCRLDMVNRNPIARVDK
ncbi:phenylalanine-tRNA ligase, alpha subunit [Spizellomyces punctatus DAOM BR117]|uniref:phenylalanine--tRNA ligase n=1 Tax=Spizellomyces punctatus (strain DAOM BR117) TaxID=645134 RepID=A0A0L0HMY9_SPIPD|nr:phenylalanine-tRNA ligase, alpha subunit [Spizellomyces punctatus DAOM BR117]KND02433.1 phenylalanine-tRNA ligase, alpha subunit [Spizellomyces punctatus DAOM BR117]|eukprot:XP_016610472.1 phenylalanine-tRNA ligase, alpha subunit [Spizellomyces punctatus DAOM BR117]